MRFWPRKKKAEWNLTPLVVDHERLLRAVNSVRNPFPSESRDEFRQSWRAHTVWFVDGKAIPHWSALTAALADGETHHISMIRGERGPELFTDITPEPGNEPEETS